MEQGEDQDDKKEKKKNVLFVRQNGGSIQLDEESSNKYIYEHFEN